MTSRSDDRTLGESLRDQAIEAVQSGSEGWVESAKALAVSIARERGVVSSDEVWEQMEAPANADPRIMGAVFRHGSWRRVGFKQSARPCCHQRPIAVWELSE